jgi:hypothetical protein
MQNALSDRLLKKGLMKNKELQNEKTLISGSPHSRGRQREYFNIKKNNSLSCII